jgi:ribosome modulation factor
MTENAKQDSLELAWQKGFEDAMAGKPGTSPYGAVSPESFSYHQGWLQGERGKLLTLEAEKESE